MSRVNTKAELVFDAVSVEHLMAASQSGAGCIGLTGSREVDGAGGFYRMTGVGQPEIGLAFFPEDGGTCCTDDLENVFRSRFGTGILVVADRYDMEFSFYIVDDLGRRVAKAVLSE